MRIKEKNSKLPKGWKRMKLGNICEIQAGGTPNRSVDTYWNGTIPWIGSASCKDKSIIKAKEFITKEGLSNSSAKLLKNGTTLIALVGATIGKTGFLKLECATNQNIVGLYPKNTEELDPFYLYLTTQTLYPVFLYLGNKQFQIANLSFVKEQKILFPPLAEQKAIANLLEVWDRAIEKTEQLISAKEQQFKWLLKKLISDQQQNPTWKTVKLDEVGTISSAGVNKKIIEGEKKVRLVNYLDVLNKDFIFSYELNHWVTAPEKKTMQCNVKKGDIFFTPSSEIQGDIAHSAVAMEDIEKAVYSYHIVRFRLTEKWDLIFRAYVFKSSYFYHQAYKLCMGSGQRYVISQDAFRNMTVSVPKSIKQQNKIAHILYTAQKEIDLLKKTMEKYRIQKKGLMQKLLTSHWRLKI